MGRPDRFVERFLTALDLRARVCRPLLDGLEKAHDQVDPGPGAVRRESLAAALKRITPHRHVAVTVRGDARAVDDPAHTLARKHAAVARGVLRQVGRDLPELLRGRAGATPVQPVTGSAVRLEEPRTLIGRYGRFPLQALDVGDDVRDPLPHADVRLEVAKERSPHRHLARPVRGDRTAHTDHERAHPFGRECAAAELGQARQVRGLRFERQRNRSITLARLAMAGRAIEIERVMPGHRVDEDLWSLRLGARAKRSRRTREDADRQDSADEARWISHGDLRLSC